MINCIVAIEKSQGIGFKGSMPWPHLKNDMQWFRKQTTGHIIIMGSTTWNSIGSKPLPNRINVVLSRSHNFSGINLTDHTFNDPSTALAFCEQEYPDKEIFIIGGSIIYDVYLNTIHKFYITEINENYPCDKFFNYNYVQKNFTNVREIAKFTDPIEYNIKEYTK